jgi:hypothetical protein
MAPVEIEIGINSEIKEQNKRRKNCWRDIFYLSLQKNKGSRRPRW